MIDQVLIETLDFKAKSLARRWKNLIRKEPQLKHYNGFTDEQLCELNMSLYPQLARALERGIDRKVVGGYFVHMGKDRMEKGIPVSELVFACSLSQKTVVDYMTSEFVNENPIAVYQIFGAIDKVNEFFFLGCFYIIKGFLEQTYSHLNSHHNVSEDILKTYFKDDFFFKNDIDEDD
ncbi:MAG: hypothetical protein LBC27_09685 [Spirochaetaceae bacterium]|jgi:hypothetical protein|nr:hypothetical protein [Spirochaetaceae bacterium]